MSPTLNFFKILCKTSKQRWQTVLALKNIQVLLWQQIQTENIINKYDNMLFPSSGLKLNQINQKHVLKVYFIQEMILIWLQLAFYSTYLALI